MMMKETLIFIGAIAVAYALLSNLPQANSEIPEGTPPPITTSFEPAIRTSEKTLLVEFSAPWCGACKALAPTVAAVSKELQETVTHYKINVDDMPELANKYEVQAIPTFLVFKEGDLTERTVGRISKTKLKSLLN